MLKWIFTFFIVFTSYSTNLLASSSIEECIIDSMPSAKTDKAALELKRICYRKYSLYSPRDSLITYFYQQDFDECISSNIGKAQSEKGALFIKQACYSLTAPYNQRECNIFLWELILQDGIAATPKDLYEVLITPEGRELSIYQEFYDACSP